MIFEAQAVLCILALLMLIFVLAFIAWISYLHHKYSHIPGPKRDNFLLGNLPSIARRSPEAGFTECVYEWSKTYGPVMCVWIAYRPAIILSDPTFVKDILVTKDFPKATLIYNLLKYMFKVRCLGEGLVTIFDREKWKRNRQIINPGFHRVYLKSLMPNYNKSADLLIRKFRDLADGETVIDLAKELHKVALDVIGKVAFGMNLNTIFDEDEPFTRAVDSVFEGIQFKLRTPFYKFRYNTFDFQNKADESVRFLRKHGLQCITKRQKMLAEGKELPDDIMSMVVKEAASDVRKSSEELVDEFVTFIAAGQETTANMMAFVLLVVMQNPSYKERHQLAVVAILNAYYEEIGNNKMTDEILDVLGDRQFVGFEDLGKLTFLGHCLKETLRMYPPAGGADRDTTEDVVYGGYKIPAGTTVAAHFFSMHRNPKYWPDPETFDPERWGKEAADNPGITGAYMPFSAGTRNCIGRVFAEFEAKVVLARLIQAYDISILPGTGVKIEQKLTLRPKGGVPAVLCPR